MKSLLLLSFPRSMSSLIADITAKSLKHQLSRPQWRSCEVLHSGNRNMGHCVKHDPRPDYFPEYEAVLKSYCKGYVIKDVNAPFMCARYIKKHPKDFNVMFLRRPLTSVIYSLFRRGWFWPVHALWNKDTRYRELSQKLDKQIEPGLILKPSPFHFSDGLPALVDACLHINEQCYEFISEKISVPKITKDHNRLFLRLKRLGYDARPFNYMNAKFKQKYHEVEAYKQDPLYSVIKDLLSDRGCRESLL